MARQDLQMLYQTLRHPPFGFLKPRQYELQDIYSATRRQHPTLCDDKFLCVDNCSSGNEEPEWHHVVRKVLQAEKSTTGRVRKGGSRGLWRIV